MKLYHSAISSIDYTCLCILQLGHMLEYSMGISVFVEVHLANMDKLKIQTVAIPVQVMQLKNVEGFGECQYTKLVRASHHYYLKYSPFKL